MLVEQMREKNGDKSQEGMTSQRTERNPKKKDKKEVIISSIL